MIKAPRQGKVIEELESKIRATMRKLENKSIASLSDLWRDTSRKIKGGLAVEYRASFPHSNWNMDTAKRSGSLFRMERIIYREMDDFKLLAKALFKREINQHYHHEYFTAAYLLDVTTPPNVYIKMRPELREAAAFSAGPAAWSAWHNRLDAWTGAYESALKANILLNAMNMGGPDSVMQEVDASRIGTPAVTFWDSISRLLTTTLLQVQNEARRNLTNLNGETVAEEIWQTIEDERVCDECGPMDGLTREESEGEEPPLHPRCRCFWRVMPRSWVDMADRELAHDMDVSGAVPDGMYIRGKDGEIKAAVVVSFTKWAEDKAIALEGK